jgi:hypothetical protein
MFYKFKPIYWMVLIGLILSLLPQGSYAQDTTDQVVLDKKLYLPIIVDQDVVQPAPDTYEVVPGFLNIPSIAAAQAEQACGSVMEKFTVPSLTAAQTEDNICLLPGRFPVMVAKKNNVVQGYGIGGTQNGTTRTAWNITSGTLGTFTMETADAVVLKNWQKSSGILTLPNDGEVVVIPLNTATTNAANLLDLPGPNPGTVMEFMENLLSHGGTSGNNYLFNVPTTQVFVNNMGLPGRTTAQCGQTEPRQVFLGRVTTLFTTGPTAKLAVEVFFVGDTPNGTLHACMSPYNYMPLADLMLAAEYSKVRQDMRDTGNNSWEQMVNWQILRPSPEVIYVITWIGATGAATYTVSEYYLKAGGGFALRAANSFLIVPRKFIECAGIDERLCTVTIQ